MTRGGWKKKLVAMPKREEADFPGRRENNGTRGLMGYRPKQGGGQTKEGDKPRLVQLKALEVKKQGEQKNRV